MRVCLSICACVAFNFFVQAQIPPPIGPTITVPGITWGAPIKLVVYGDTRFTDPSDVTDTNPKARQFLAKQVADEKPLAVFLTGDTPFTGADPADWKVFQQETSAWREEHLYIFPTTGNHETKGGAAAGIANYLANFPQLKGCRYYSAQIGNLYLIAIDVTQYNYKQSPQGRWFQSQLEHIPPGIDFVFIMDHMPWMADLQSQIAAGLPGPNELALRDLVEAEAEKSRAKFIVLNGHIHNYERFERKGITYIISGGGGAKPYPISCVAMRNFTENPIRRNRHRSSTTTMWSFR
ncbi:metallophosphoesterase family protein [Alloacidobacterium sp.]|uniref:metallophosphoesterase family protein n=1 Tax=Alloacidobacterium sp. TaxID=2951999 RepID=UPI002D250E21|nr:metallophosphoesterase [Alloacidobacterium sp.]HYK38162.1 metallophosphoesterase [Alloacidobacterium sp.]